jgi:antitoxin YefM
MSITASEARKSLFPLIKKVNEDHDAIEIVSKPANARRLLKAYENALNGVNLAEHLLIDPDAADPRGGDR